MKNNKGNKHLKNEPFWTLGDSLKEYYHVILTRMDLEDTFEYIVCKDKGSGLLDSSASILDACIFRTEKDAETYLTKLVRNTLYDSLKELGDKKRGSLDKVEVQEEMKYYRVMSIKEMMSPYRQLNEQKEIDLIRSWGENDKRHN